VVSTGNTKYGQAWVELYQRLGIESVWGRCYEQTDADHICDRGSPHGFYYLRPDCYKAPNTAAGGLISVPWLSNDPNLVFRCGFQSTFTFDPDDPMSMGFIGAGRCEYWFALVNELQKQTRYNKFVPLVIQQEYGSGGLHPRWLEPMDELLAYLKRKGTAVVGQAEAVRRYKAASGDRTPPTYGVFDNLGKLDIVQHPLPSAQFTFEVTTNRLRTAFMGAPFNGYYTTDWDNRSKFEPASHELNRISRRARIRPYFGTPPSSWATSCIYLRADRSARNRTWAQAAPSGRIPENPWNLRRFDLTTESCDRPVALYGGAIEHQDCPRDSIPVGESERRMDGLKSLC
jgi:hypothetical protein